MKRSLNEIEATAKRAARGAGYSWGLAEEASKATRWLCRNGHDGVAALAVLLDKDLAGSGDHRPHAAGETWRGARDLCPLVTGAFLSDCARRLRTAPVEMDRVAVPLFILPFAANAAAEMTCCVTVEMDGHVAETDGDILLCPDMLPDLAEQVRVRARETMSSRRSRSAQMCPDPDSWDRLAVLAHRTYAPATRESRLLGAGAGLSDND